MNRPVDLGAMTTCLTCGEQLCNCPERQPDGGWKAGETSWEEFERIHHPRLSGKQHCEEIKSFIRSRFVEKEDLRRKIKEEMAQDILYAYMPTHSRDCTCEDCGMGVAEAEKRNTVRRRVLKLLEEK